MGHFLDFLAHAKAHQTDPAIGVALTSVPPDDAYGSSPLPPRRESITELESDPSGFVGLDEIASQFWRRRRLMLAFALAGLVAAVVVTAFWKPVYRAKTTVRLDIPPDPYSTVSDPRLLAASKTADPSESYLQNEIKMLQSDSLAERVAETLEAHGARISERQPPSSPLKGLLGYLGRGSSPPSAEDLRINFVRKAMTIRPSLKSQVVEIDFDANDPTQAAMGANAVVTEYTAINRESQMKAAQETTAWLSSQLSDLRAKLDRENTDLKAFASGAGLIYSANQGALTEQRVSEIQAQLTKAEADSAATQSRYETAVSSPLEALPDGNETLLRDYEASLVEAERDLMHLRTVYTPENYKVKDAESRVAAIQASIQRERVNIIQRRRTDYDAATRLQRSIEGSYLGQTRKLQSQSADIFRYTAMKHELDSTQQLYDSLLQKIKEAEIASSLQTTNVRLIDMARPPSDPYSPNRWLNGVIGLGSGLFLGLITILIRDRGAIPMGVVPETRAIRMRELGAIPDASHTPLLNNGSRTALLDKQRASGLTMAAWHTQSPLAESYSSTIASILFSSGGENHHIFSITSVEPQEGKTTIITNLGIVLAETYKRVLLIDGDLRRPSLHRIFGQCNDTGLTTLLTGGDPLDTLDLSQCVASTTVPNLFLLASGPGIPSVAPLLHSPRMAQLLERAGHEFDCVLIDTPPTSLFSDARLLGRLSDSVILVFDAQRANREAVSSAYNQFLDDGTTVLGAIRNRSDLGWSRRTYNYYQSYVTH